MKAARRSATGRGVPVRAGGDSAPNRPMPTARRTGPPVRPRRPARSEASPESAESGPG